MTKAEEPAKNWQVSALEKAQEFILKQNEKLDTKVSNIAMSQITTPQFEERLSSTTRAIDDKLKSLQEKHDSDIREVNLKYGPLADNIKWATRGILLLVIAQLLAFAFNLYGGK